LDEAAWEGLAASATSPGFVKRVKDNRLKPVLLS
jgi:hypothetical protein